jgi:chemotaxis protein CheX
MKAKYINPFLSASLNLFNSYLGLNAVEEKPFLNPDRQNLYEVSGIIGLAGETQGAVVVSFPRTTAIKVASILTGIEYTAMGSDVIDCVGEITNIIAGNAKKDLLDFRINISLPGVITGNHYQINWPKGIPVITIPFNSSIGAFSVNVSLKEIDQ